MFTSSPYHAVRRSPTTPPPDLLKESSLSADDQKDEINLRSSIPFPFLREETHRSSSRLSAFYAIYVSPLQPPQLDSRTRSTGVSLSDRVKRLISVGSNFSVGSGVKLSDVEKGLDWTEREI